MFENFLARYNVISDREVIDNLNQIRAQVNNNKTKISNINNIVSTTNATIANIQNSLYNTRDANSIASKLAYLTQKTNIIESKINELNIDNIHSLISTDIDRKLNPILGTLQEYTKQIDINSQIATENRRTLNSTINTINSLSSSLENIPASLVSMGFVVRPTTF